MKVIIMKKKSILLGQQNVTEWTLLEYKKFFSIKLFHFHKTNGSQDRFHTHAFNAYSILLKGNYIEEVIKDNQIIPLNRNRKIILFIPKDNYHRITKSKGCWTLLFTGSWGKTFKELRETENINEYVEYICGEHRIDINKGSTYYLKNY
jgi:hypothetical protein